MEEIDKDKLIERFLRENKKEVEDFGFSRRVMHRLPRRGDKLAKLWAVFCTAVAVALFFIYDGFGAIEKLFAGWLGMFVRGEFNLTENVYLVIAFAVLAAVGIHRLCTAE